MSDKSSLVLEAQVATSLRRLRSLRNRELASVECLADSMRGLKSSWVKRPAHLAHPQQHAVAHTQQRKYEPTAANTRSKRGWTSARSGKMYARVYLGAAGDGEDVGGGARTVGGMAEQSISADVLRSFSHPSATRKIGWVARMNAVEEGIAEPPGSGAGAGDSAASPAVELSDAPPAPDVDTLFGQESVGLRVQRTAHGYWKGPSGYRPRYPTSCLLKRARPVRGAKMKTKASTSFVTVSELKLKPRKSRAVSPPARPDTSGSTLDAAVAKVVAQP